MSIFASLGSSLKLSTPLSAVDIKSNTSGNISTMLNSLIKLPVQSTAASVAQAASQVKTQAHAAPAPTPVAPMVISGKYDKISMTEDFKWSKSYSAYNLKDISTIVEPSISGKFHTQNGAASYISDNLPPSYAGAQADAKVKEAVRQAVANWQPGQDLSKLVHDAVKKVLTGVISDNPPLIPGALFQTPTPDSIANQMSRLIQANGSTPIDVAEHMLAAAKAYRPPA